MLHLHVLSMINVWTINGEPKLYGNGETGLTGITLPHFVPFLCQDNDFKCHVMAFLCGRYSFCLYWWNCLNFLIPCYCTVYAVIHFCGCSFSLYMLCVGRIVDNHFLSHLYLIKKTLCRFKSVNHENEVKIMWHILD